MNDIEQELRDRLQTIGAQVTVGEVPDPRTGREPRTRLIPLVAAAATIAVVVVVAAAVVADNRVSRVDVVDAPGTTAAGLLPTSCVDDRPGPVQLSGQDNEGPWEFSVAGEAPTITATIRYLPTAARPEGGGSSALGFTAESWTDTVERGVLGLFSSQREPTSSAIILIGALPAQARAIRVSYNDGRVRELCTVGRRLGLPIVFFVAQLDGDDPPRSMTAIDRVGNALVTGDVQRHAGDQAPPLWIDLQLNHDLVALPLRPDPVDLVPAVVGLRLLDAQRVLAEHGFDGSAHERDPDFDAALVVAQEPPAGTATSDRSDVVGLRTVVPDPPQELECDGYQHPHEAGSADGLPTAEQVSRAAAEQVAFELQDEGTESAYVAQWNRWVWQSDNGDIEVVPFDGFQVVVVANENDCGPVVPQFIDGVPVTEARGPIAAFAETLAETTEPRDTDLTPDQVQELCEQVERQGQLRATDTTEDESITALVAAVPSAYRTDAALFYYPHGGDIPPGTDTSGITATAAGARLYELYSTLCGYAGP